MTTKILATSLFALLVAGCTGDHTTTGPSAAATTAPKRVPTLNAVRVHGDVMPTRLVALAIPKPTEAALLAGSDAMAPKKPFVLETPAEPVNSRDFHRVMKGTDPASYTFPIDAPVGARVIVRPVDPTLSLATVHMHDVATGLRLDLARDASTSQINVRHIPSTATAPTDGPRDHRVEHPEMKAPSEMLTGAIDREPGFEPLALTSRLLAFDVPSKPGLVQIDVPADIGVQGVIVEVQQPNTHVSLTGVVDELNHGFGDTAELTFSVANDAAMVPGATLTGWAELPNHTHAADFTFTAVGNGQYTAKLPLASADTQYIGVWGIHVKANGTVNGVAFERDLETGFGYYPAHAQMTGLGVPQILRGADGLIDEVSVDVDVETLADDRFSVRGTLTFTDEQGLEHALSSAQTGQTINAGLGTITLHFSAASMALAQVEGVFHVRDVALVSQAFGVTQHRIGLGLDLATDHIAMKEIRYPTKLSIQAQDLVDNGDIVLRKP